MRKVIASPVRALKWAVLGPVSLGFGAAVWVRNRLYDWGVLPTHKLPVPVVSIGNLSYGGTGKTPLAIFLAQHLTEHGLRVGYLSRGYGRKSTGYVRAVPGTTGARDIGDEALEVALKCPQVVVAVCENRVRGVKQLLAETPVDVVVLDDAFQHRRIHRDIDIVCLDGTRPAWRSWLIPAGRLRELPRALRRADYCFVQKAGEIRKRSYLKRFPDSQVAFTKYRITALVPAFPGLEELRPQQLHQRPVVVFSALANNAQFRQQLLDENASVKLHYQYRDHHVFRDKDLRPIRHAFVRLARKDYFTHRPILLTTRKDYVRIAEGAGFPEKWPDLPVYYPDFTLEFVRGADIFEALLAEILERTHANATPRTFQGDGRVPDEVLSPTAGHRHRVGHRPESAGELLRS